MKLIPYYFNDLGDKANIDSPSFTGIPKAPTAASGTNTTQIATTAFVKTACDSKVDTSWTKIFDESYTTDFATGTIKTITWSDDIFNYTEMVVLIKVDSYRTTLYLPRPLFNTVNNIIDIDYNNRQYVYTLQFQLSTGTKAFITNPYKAGFTDSQTKIVQIYVR